MKKVLYLLPLSLLFLCTSVVAQKANVDSLELVAQIAKDQVKLGKLQNMVDKQMANKKTAGVDTQNSASDNVRAAEKLNADPNNKKLASEADSKASDAKSDAGKARKETRKMNELNKDIFELKDKIATAQARLRVYSPAPLDSPLPMPIPQADTTQHP